MNSARKIEIPNRSDFLALAAMALLIVLVFAPVWAYDRWFVSDGQFAHFFARPEAWSDAWVGGWPAATDPATYAWYPLRLLLQPLGAFNAFVIAGYMVAATGLYWYLRLVDVTPAGSALGALGFASSGFMIGHLWNAYMVHAAGWLPWTLAAIEACLQSRGRQWPLVIAVTVALSLLTGHTQTAIYGLIVTAAYVILRLPSAWRAQRIHGWVCAAGAPVAGAILVAPHLFATFAYLPETPRAHLTYEQFVVPALSWMQVPLLFFPFVFGGGMAPYPNGWFGPKLFPASCHHMPLILLLLAIGGTCDRRRRSDALFWCAVLGLGFSLALGNEIPRLARLVYETPVVNLFRAPGRHVMEVGLATSILAAFGFDALTKSETPRKDVWLVAAIAVTVTLLGALYAIVNNYDLITGWAAARRLPIPEWRHSAALWIPIGLAVPTLGACAVGISKQSRRTKRISILAVAALQAWAFVGFAQWNVTSPSVDSLTPSPIEQQVIDGLRTSGGRVLNVAGIYGELLTPERSKFFGLSSANWYSPLIPVHAAAALAMQWWGAASAATLMAPGDVALDVYGIRYVVAGREDGNRSPDDRFRLIGTHGREAIWENSRALPFAWLVGKWTELDDESAARVLHGGGFSDGRAFDPAREAIVADLASSEIEGFDQGSTVKAHWAGVGKIQATIDSRTPALVVFGVNHLPGWRGTIDGDPVTIQRANVALSALVIPAGRHEVRLTYKRAVMPFGVQLGLATALAGFSVLCLWRQRAA